MTHPVKGPCPQPVKNSPNSALKQQTMQLRNGQETRTLSQEDPRRPTETEKTLNLIQHRKTHRNRGETPRGTCQNGRSESGNARCRRGRGQRGASSLWAGRELGDAAGRVLGEGTWSCRRPSGRGLGTPPKDTERSREGPRAPQRSQQRCRQQPDKGDGPRPSPRTSGYRRGMSVCAGHPSAVRKHDRSPFVVTCVEPERVTLTF